MAAVAVGLLGGIVEAKPPEIFPLSKVRRGQTGYGLSTFSGTEPTRWEFEIVGVLKNFRPKMDLILIKTNDPQMDTPGFWRGMSGSPLFIEDKLVCAFSYAYTFSKKPVGGCTPIQYMIDEGLNAPVRANRVITPKAKKRGHSSKKSTPRWIAAGAVDESEWLEIAPDRRIQSALASLGEERQPWIMRAPLPTTPSVTNSLEDDPTAIAPASVPLAVSGFSGPAYDMVKELMKPYPIEPMQAGGTGSSDEGPSKFSLGAPISVQLARGDASFAATGTVSYIDGDKVLAFGHPFFGQGEFYAPVTISEVHTVVPSQIAGFVIASPLRELGSLVQDRLTAIMADTSFRNRLIPMSVFIEASDGKTLQKGEFHVEILNNKFLTAPLAGMMAMNAINRYLPDRDHATVLMESTVEIKGYEPLHFVDYLHAADGATRIIGGARGLRVIVPVLFNPYTPAEIERIEINFKLTFEPNYGTIIELRLPSTELTPGVKNYVKVVMERYDKKQVVQSIPFDVPKRLAGSVVKLEVVPGDVARLDVAPPENFDDMMAAFRKLLPGNIFAVTLYTAEQGIAIDGKLVRDLPASALDRLRTGSRSQRASGYKQIVRSTAPSTRVINGGKSILVKVADH